MTSSHSQAGNQQGDIRDDLEVTDINNSTKCGVDALLKYFLSLVLGEDDPKKRRLNELQTKIENLQSQRYYNLDGNGDTATRTDGTGIAEAESAGTQRAGTGGLQDTSDQKNVDPDDDTQFGSAEEKRLVKERDEILDALLHDVLEAVLPHANNRGVKDKLNAFAQQFAGRESARYGPYVLLCNDVLGRLTKLGSIGTNFRVRKPDDLTIRFHTNDSKPIISRYEGMPDLERKPDFVITSLQAAQCAMNTHPKAKITESVAFSNPPHMRFNWPNILSCGEFKVLKHRIPEIDLQKPFQNTSSPQTTLRYADLPEVDSNNNDNNSEAPITEANAKLSHLTIASGSKRPRDDESVPEIPSLSKKPRQLDPKIPSGSNVDLDSGISAAATNPNPQLEVNVVQKNIEDAASGREQCASYALEMLSYSAGVHHAINLLFTDEYMWIWYYDRQGIVQSYGISIFADFPRFLVLLFAFQRFTVQDWGIIPCLNPKAMHGLGLETDEQGQPLGSTVSLNLAEDLEGLRTDDGRNEILAEVNVNMAVFLSHQSHCLAGRATLVFPADGVAQDRTSVSTPMVCKIYHPEVQRRHEGQTLQVVHQIAKEKDEKMAKHLPFMYFYGDVPGCTTQRIRSMVKRNWKGHRTLRILGLKKLDKITSLQGADFIKAWLETLICHSFLWKNYVEHGDPSLSNIMYDPEEGCGVLSDFDLSLLQWEPRVVTDRTGTVPFMAIDLLTKGYWEGTVQRFYHHEMESFIWILAYVVLYDKGARKASPEVEAWRTSNYATCYKEKTAFYTNPILMEVEKNVQPSYQVYWHFVHQLCLKLHRCHLNNYDRVSPAVAGPVVDAPFEASQELWSIFVTALELIKGLPGLPLLLGRLQVHKPSFRMPNPVEQERLRRRYRPIFN